jgi:hypothetical protein
MYELCMVASKDSLIEQIDSLNEEQLKEVGHFIAFLKFRSRTSSWQIDSRQVAEQYKQFAQEDSLLAEEGMDEYANILKQEDLA